MMIDTTFGTQASVLSSAYFRPTYPPPTPSALPPQHDPPALARQGDTGARVSTWLELMPYLAADVVEQLWDEIAALFPRLRSMSLIGHAWQIADRLPVRHLPALLEQAGDLLITNVVDHVLRVSTERLGTEAPAALQRFVDEASVQSNVALAHAHLARISQGSDRDYYRARAEAVRRFDAPLATMPVDAVLLEFVEGAAAQTTVDDWLTQARANCVPRHMRGYQSSAFKDFRYSPAHTPFTRSMRCGSRRRDRSTTIACAPSISPNWRCGTTRRSAPSSQSRRCMPPAALRTTRRCGSRSSGSRARSALHGEPTWSATPLRTSMRCRPSVHSMCS